MTESWLSALKSPELIFAVMLTAKTCLVAGAGFLVLAPPLAWLFARREGVGVRALSFFVTLPLVFPPVALGYLLLLLIGRSGPLGGMLDAVGISIVFTPWAVYLAAFIAGLPLVIRPIQGALASEQLKALEFAARVHGAPPLTVYRKVTLPLVRGQILSGLLLGISRASGEVGITMMVGGNISDRTNTLSLEIWNAVSRADFDVATTLCLLLSAFTLLIFIVLDRLQRRAGALYSSPRAFQQRPRKLCFADAEMKRLILVTGPQSLKRLQHGFLRQLLRFGQLIGGQFVAQHAGICRCIAVWSIVFLSL